MATEKYANSPTPSSPSTAWATITAGINASETGLALSTLSPFPATVQFRILIGNELMLVTALPGGLAATVTRGIEGTTAASHASGASVYHVLSAAALARSPRSMTTLGDIEYLDANGAPARLSIGSVGQVFTVAGGLPSWASPVSGGVTSVAITVPSILSVAGSPITTSGTLAVTLATQAANLIFAGPTTGSAAAPTFRAMVTADLGTTLAPTFQAAAMIWEPTDFTDPYKNQLDLALTLNPSAPATGNVQRGLHVMVETKLGNTQNFQGVKGNLVEVIHRSIGDAGHLAAGQFFVEVLGPGAADDSLAFKAFFAHSGSGTVASAIGVEVEVSNYANGVIPAGAGIDIYSENSGGGTCGQYRHINLWDLTSADYGSAQAINYGEGKFIVDADGKVTVPAAGLTIGSSLVTLGGAFTTSGANALTLTTTGSTNVTLPTSGTLATTSALAAYLPLAGGTMTGALLFTDNSFDIGASGATRPRTGYFATSIVLGTSGVLVGGVNVVEQYNGTAGQAFRVYGTYTDASNYVRAALAATSTLVTLSADTAGTGADDINIAITPAGAGQLRINTSVLLLGSPTASLPSDSSIGVQNGKFIYWRNAANSAWGSGFGSDSSNDARIGGGSGSAVASWQGNNTTDLGKTSNKWRTGYFGTSVDSAAYVVGGVAGVSFGPSMVTSITVVNGIVTAIS